MAAESDPPNLSVPEDAPPDGDPPGSLSTIDLPALGAALGAGFPWKQLRLFEPTHPRGQWALAGRDPRPGEASRHHQLVPIPRIVAEALRRADTALYWADLRLQSALDDDGEPPAPGEWEEQSRGPQPCPLLVQRLGARDVVLFQGPRGTAHARLTPNEAKLLRQLVKAYGGCERLTNRDLLDSTGVISPDTYLRKLRNRGRNFKLAILPNGNSKPGHGANTRNWWMLNPAACLNSDFPESD
jgi:hypothetical protein